MQCFSGNPYLPNYEYVPDGEPHIFENRLYVYGSHDRFGGDDFCLNDYVGWSAPLHDLTDWRYEGVIYRREEDPLIRQDSAMRLFAPDAAQGPDGRYYLYYGLSHSGVLHVAVSDTPAGTFTYYGAVCHPDGSEVSPANGDMFQYDPAVLVDDDGSIYLYSGFCFDAEKIPKFKGLPENREGMMVFSLAPDMKTVTGAPQIVIPSRITAAGTAFAGHGFFEAASIRKFEDLYYLVYSSEQSHELCYAVSCFPDQGFRYGGVVISNGDIGYQGRCTPLNYTGTNHGGIVRIGSESYIFYQRQSGGTPYARQGCAERIHFAEDGSIAQVCMTSCGMVRESYSGPGKLGAYRLCALMSADGACAYTPKTRIGQAHPFLTQDGEDRDHTPGQYLTNLRDGAKAGYRYFHFSGYDSLMLSMRGSADGTMEVRFCEDGDVIGIIPVKPSGSWQTSSAVPLPQAEKAELWLTFRGTGFLDLEDLIFH